MDNFSITAIVPAYNASATLAECIEALLAQRLDYPLEIIVVDDGSTDTTAAIVQHYATQGVKLLQVPHKGAGAARNAGIKNASGNLLLFTDADCVPAADWAAIFVRAFAEDGDLAAAKGTYRTRQRNLIARFVQAEYADRYRRMRKAANIDFIDTYSAAYRREVLLQENFDSRYPGAIVEDAELAFRLAERGFKMRFVPEANVYHYHVTSFSGYFRRKFKIGYWRVAVYRQHPEKLRGDSHTPQIAKVQMLLVAIMIFAAMVSLVLRLISGSPKLARFFHNISLASVAIFGLTTLPFIKNTWTSDKTVALFAPIMLFVRALALTSGAICGIVQFAIKLD